MVVQVKFPSFIFFVKLSNSDQSALGTVCAFSVKKYQRRRCEDTVPISASRKIEYIPFLLARHFYS